MKNWDVIVIGGGIIGFSLAIELRKKGSSVLVVERGEPGREASYAAGGMLADCTIETPSALQPLATASARMYPEFVHELQVESALPVDLRDQGAIVFPPPEHVYERPGFTLAKLLPAPLAELEPALAEPNRPAFYVKERSVDPRGLTAAALAAAKRRGVDISSGDAVTAVNLSDGRVSGVTTKRTSFHAPKVVNCAGAWAGQIAPHAFPTRPVKGQMLHGFRRQWISPVEYWSVSAALSQRIKRPSSYSQRQHARPNTSPMCRKPPTSSPTNSAASAWKTWR
jgi:glycine oxidase